MSDNPLSDDPAREQRIRERAYHLWKDAGEPHGRHDDFWERARELVGMEEASGFGQLPNPATVPGADPAQVQPIEEASIQENLGEFPGRLTDQGEDQQTPKAPVRAARAKAAKDPGAVEPTTGAAGPAADKPKPAAAAKPSTASKPPPKPAAPAPKAVPAVDPKGAQPKRPAARKPTPAA